MDIKFRCFMEPEVVMRRRKFSRKFKIEAVKLVRKRGVSVAQAAVTWTSMRTCCANGSRSSAPIRLRRSPGVVR